MLPNLSDIAANTNVNVQLGDEPRRRPTRENSMLTDEAEALSPDKLAVRNLLNESANQKNRGSMNEIVETYNQVQDVLTQLDTIHTAIIQKHEADFITSYKDHMLKVQLELVQFKKKSSEYYQNLKKDEKIKLLESQCKWVREEAIKLHGQIATHKDNFKNLQEAYKQLQDEMYDWQFHAKCLKKQNILLTKTIEKLKSPSCISKYEERGRQLAEQDIKKLLMATNQSARTYQQASAVKVVDNEGLQQSGLDLTKLNRQDSLTIEQGILAKIRLMNSFNLDDAEGGMRQDEVQIKARTKSQSNLWRENTGSQTFLQNSKRSNLLGNSVSRKQIQVGLQKPASAHPSRRVAQQAKMMPMAKQRQNRLQSTRNGQTQKYSATDEEETKAITDFGNQSLSNLNQTQGIEYLVEQIQNIVEDKMQNPDELKQSLIQEFQGQNLRLAKMTERVTQLEKILNKARPPKQTRNQDLSANLTHFGSDSVPETGANENVTSQTHFEKITAKPASYPNIFAQQNSQRPPLNKTTFTDNMISSSKLGMSATEEELLQYKDKSAQQLVSQRGSRHMPPEMLQELFFECIASMIKNKRAASAQRSEFSPVHSMKRNRSQDRMKESLMKSSASATAFLGTQKAFQKTADKDKQQVLLDFIQNKHVLQSLYELMFNDRNHRNINKHGSKDIASLLMQQTADAQMLQSLHQQRRRNGGIRSAGIRSTRQPFLDANIINHSLLPETCNESLNVVVDFQNDKLRHQSNVNSHNTLLGGDKISEPNEQASGHTPQQEDASEFENEDHGGEVLSGGNKMTQEVSRFAHRYPINASPDDSPKKQGYVPDQQLMHFEEPKRHKSRAHKRPSYPSYQQMAQPQSAAQLQHQMMMQKQRVVGGGASIRHLSSRGAMGSTGIIKSGQVVTPGSKLSKKHRPQSSYRIKDGKLLINNSLARRKAN